MVTLKQLRYALAVEKTRHFKQAADLCAISPSALSTAIAELETQLEIQIFERDNKNVLLTPLGELILEKAQDITFDVQELHLLAQSQKIPLSYPMTLGVIPTIGPYLLPKVLPQVRESFPNFQLTIIEEQSHILVEKVKSGEIDTAILALPYPLEGLLSFTFWQEDFYVISNNDDKLANLKEISSMELKESNLLLLKDGNCLKDHAMSACKLQATESLHSFEGTSLSTLVQMVAGRMGTTLVPEMALSQLVSETTTVKASHLNEPGPHREIAFIMRPHYAGTHNIEALIKLFKQQLT